MDTSAYWTTFYALVAGDDVFSADEFEAVFASALTVDFKAFDHATCDFMAPSYAQDVQDGVSSGYDIVGGALDGYPTSQPFSYLSGCVWHLYNKNRPPDIGGAMRRIRGAPRQSILDAGYFDLQLSLAPYGAPLAGFRHWPAMPSLPIIPGADPSIDQDQPVAKSNAAWWWLAAALAAPSIIKRLNK